MEYHEQQRRENIRKLRELILELPEFCVDYFRGIEPTTAERTRLGYAHDLRIFFQFLLEYEPSLQGKTMHEITLQDLDKIGSQQLELFLDYLSYYSKPGEDEEYQNGERGKARKISAVRSLFKYFYKKEALSANPAQLVSTPKIHEKNIIRLDTDEIARMLDEVESGEKLTERQQKYHAHTKIRDLALVTLFLGTGMRVSECVGLDITDIDFANNGLRILRKGGNQTILYFGSEVEDVLREYLPWREQIEAVPGHENALFLSMQRKRLTVRAVENLVKKYARTVTQLKNISPHKLRSSYGTALYNETGDIYLVADVLGHKDVNTTRKHYAQIEENRRRGAANAIHLRRDD